MSGSAGEPYPGDHPMRRPVAVLVSRFPLVTETFILREIDELERQGQPVVLVPLIRERADVIHPEAMPWIDRALYTRFLSPAILAANLRSLSRRPGRYLGTLWSLVLGTLPSPSFLVRSVLLFPKAVYLGEELHRRGVAHVHAHFATHPATMAWVASRLFPLTFSFTAHAHDLFVDSTFLGDKARDARFVRAISEFNQRWLVERWPEIEGEIAVIRMGIPIERYLPAEERDSSGPATHSEAEGPPLVLCVAALKPYKGIPVLLEACELLRGRGLELRCRIVGEGPERQGLERAIRERGLGESVELLGARTQEEVAELMARARLVVLPSVVAPDGQMEGLPVVLMEAAAAERAIVAPELSGIPELVEHGESGLLFPPGDARTLADHVEDLLRDPERARRLARQARRRVDEEFRLEDTAAALLRRIDPENPPPAQQNGELALRVLGPEGPIGIEGAAAGPDARVLHLLVGSPERPRRVVLKEHRSRPGESAPPRERAEREAGILRRLDALRQEGVDLGAPRLLHRDGESAALLLESVQGRPLDSLLRRWRLSSSSAGELETAGRRCGVWLRRFQDAVEPDRGSSPAAAWIERMERSIRSEPNGGALSGKDRRGVLDLLESGARTLGREPAVARHGDFWPGNVRLHEGEVSVLDFEGFGTGTPWEDPAAFLVHGELYFPPPLRRRFQPLEEGFLSGFGRSSGPALAVCKRAEALILLGSGSWRTGSPVLAFWRRSLLLGILRGDVP